MGGGVALYISNCISFRVLDFNVISEFVEQMWVILDVNGFKLAVGIVYRPPNANLLSFLNSFQDCVSQISFSCDGLVCLGDMNIDLLTNTPGTRRYKEVVDGLGLHQIIRSPTRITPYSSTLIDHILVSDIDLVLLSGVNDTLAISDHSLVFVVINATVPKFEACTRFFRDFNRLDMVSFESDLRLISWVRLFKFRSIDEKVGFFNAELLALFDRHAPLVARYFRKLEAPWITPVIRQMMDVRDRARKRFDRTNNPATHTFYKDMVDLVDTSLQAEKSAYFDWLAKNDSKKMWSELKKFNIRRNPNTKLGAPLSDVSELNRHFVSISAASPPVSINLLVSYSSSVKEGISSEFSFSAVSVEDIRKVLSSISSDSYGSDGLSISMIKMCCPFILPYITYIVNCCLLDGVFPHAWKEALVTPIAKCSNPSSFGDLRPISILCALSKVVEKIVDFQLRQHLSSNKILPGVQSGFRPGFSCSSALALVVDDVLKSVDDGRCTVAVLLDYSKAFDTIHHGLLLSILHHIGLSAGVLSFFRNYLSLRSQRVRLSHTVSESLPLSSGVPQGSILGPLLYIVYTTFLYKPLLHCQFHLYADDTQLYYSFSPSEVDLACLRVNADLDILSKGSSGHALSLNPVKSHVLLFGNKKHRQSIINRMVIRLNGQTLPFTDQARNLGLKFDSDLRFHQHVSDMVKRAYSSLRSLYPFRKSLSIPVRKTLCDSLVLCHFNFCDVVYGPCLDTFDSYRIQKVQNSCLRFIFGLNRRQHVSRYLPLISWLNMSDRRKLHMGVFVHKLILLKTPPYLYERIRFRTDIHNLNLRFRGHISIPRYRTTTFKRSFSYNVSACYNGFPDVLKSLSLHSFRSGLRSFLLSGASS